MTHVFATRRLRLSRLARLRAVRALACLLAISLALGGYLPAATPLHAAMAAAASTGADEGCGHEGMAMPAKHLSAMTAGMSMLVLTVLYAWKMQSRGRRIAGFVEYMRPRR